MEPHGKTESILENFLRTLFGNDFKGHLAIWIKQNKHTRTFEASALGEAISYAGQASHTQDVYYGLGLLGKKPEGGRGIAADVCGLPGLWLDVDIAGDAHKSGNCPPDLSAAIDILSKFPLKPTLIIMSGHGIHCYWLFHQVWYFGTEQERKMAAKLSKEFQLTLIDNAKTMGYHLDNTSDLARVLRLPGTLNHKTEPAQLDKVLEHHTDEEFLYEPSQFLPFLRQMTKPELTHPKPADNGTSTILAVEGAEAPALAEAILAPTGCAWMAHCRDDSAVLSEPEWYMALTVISRCRDAETLAHQMSRDYPDYNREETTAKLEHATSGSGPVTCQYIKDTFGSHCEGCPHDVTSPIVLGRKEVTILAATHDATVKEALRSAQAGNLTAHLGTEALTAFAYQKLNSLAEFTAARQALKDVKCPLTDFDKAVNGERRRLSALLTSTGAKTTTEVRPPQPIYDDYVACLRGTGYLLDSLGNLCSDDGEGNPIVLANFVARPIKQIILDDGMSQEQSFLIEGVGCGGTPLKLISVNTQEFFSMNWALLKWGMEACIKSGFSKRDQVRESIQILGKHVVTETVFTHLGWRHFQERWVYLHANGAVGSDSARVLLDNYAGSYGLPDTVKDIGTAAGRSLALLDVAPHRVTLPLLALVYLTPLLEAARTASCEPRFLVWLYGLTGTFKTTLSLLFLHHFGTFTSSPASFKDTTNALEHGAFTTKDSLLLIDDFHPSSSLQEAKRMESTAQFLLRLLGDRISKGRMTADIKRQKDYPPRGMALVTGESMIGGESSVARLLSLEIRRGEVNLERLTQAQKSIGRLSEAMRGYLEWLAPRMDDLPTLLSERFTQLRSAFQRDGQHGRIGETLAWLQIGLEYALEFAVSAGTLAADSKDSLLEEGTDVLTELAESQSAEVNAEMPARKFLNVLRELLVSGKVQLSQTNFRDNNTDIYSVGTHIGYQDADYYYLLPEITYLEVNKFLAGCNEPPLPSERTLLKRLDEAGVIRTEIETRSNGKTRKQHLPKKQIILEPNNKQRLRLVNLRKDALEVSED